VKAYRVYLRGWLADSKPCAITMATTRGKAIRKNFEAAKDAGYEFKWNDFRATRAPEYDGLFEEFGAFSWGIDYFEKMTGRLDGRVT